MVGEKAIEKQALKFVILIGIVSLCADATYEGGRSISGAYLGFLGASGTVVGLVAGVGELIGFGLRLLTGYLSDKTRQYWSLTTLGYIINTAAMPLLAFGIFYLCYGLAWFLGSALMGVLYDRSITTLVVFSAVIQLVALPIFFWVSRSSNP